MKTTRALRFFLLLQIATLALHSSDVFAAGSNPSYWSPTAKNALTVAFVISDDADVIDMAGPWEVFQDVVVKKELGYRLYTVAESKAPVRLSSGLMVIPDFSFEDAPTPQLVVVGKQGGEGPSPTLRDWVRKMNAEQHTLMSVCTGAFVLADAGLLDGKPATTHHNAYKGFAKMFPRVKLEKGKRWVQSDPMIYTSGGLTSGIDLALHMVEMHYGRLVATETAAYLEHEGAGWKR
jgi:transcriptional regulator GlxA family with amidase domain